MPQNNNDIANKVDSFNIKLDSLLSEASFDKRPDPTVNVLALVEASVKRIDDLLVAERSRINQYMELTVSHAEELRSAESKRVDAIRAVDINAVTVANDRAVQQASILANQLVAATDGFRKQIADLNTQLSDRINFVSNQMSQRISDIEKSQSARQGSGAGMKELYGWIAGGIVLLIAIANFVLHR
jgi:hypothetical protein